MGGLVIGDQSPQVGVFVVCRRHDVGAPCGPEYRHVTPAVGTYPGSVADG